MVRYEHPFLPVFDEKSVILILGSFPSVVSRKQNFYYAHPQNRFWKIISYLTETNPIPPDSEGKKFMLFTHKIALWDVIQSCDIEGSNDHNITNIILVDLSLILRNFNLKHIFINGSRAYELYNQYFFNISIAVSKLPSTSSANASYDFKRLIHYWNGIKQYLNQDFTFI
jgi:hypoxanthine-DNA glycosylase